MRTCSWADFDAGRLADRKGGRLVSLCLPARDEEATVGDIVSAVRRRLVDDVPLVDEILVCDDGSTDRTAEVAAAAGARVVATDDVLPECGRGAGKGEALWKAVAAADGDILAFVDADLRQFDPRFVVGLVGPLLAWDDVAFVKAFYDRPYNGVPGEGGRVTELVARPVLRLLFPELADIRQPLAGEFAARRDLLEELPFVQDYGVDIGLLLDVAAARGPAVIAQVDLGVRVHRNRPLSQLGAQAEAVLRSALARAGVKTAATADLAHRTRPPLVDVPSYRPLSA